MNTQTTLQDKIRYNDWKARKRAYDKKQHTKRIALKIINLIIQTLIVGSIGYAMLFAIPAFLMSLLGW